MIVTNLKS